MKLKLNPKKATPEMTREMLQADLERRRSNAARPRPGKRLRRQMSRRDSKRAAIRDAS